MGNTGGCQLGPDTLGKQVDLVVADAPAIIQLWVVTPGGPGPLGGAALKGDFTMIAGSGQLVQGTFANAIGFRAKSFLPGSPATVYATIWQKGDAEPSSTSYGSGTAAVGRSGPV